jgi:hypothetical protein
VFGADGKQFVVDSIAGAAAHAEMLGRRLAEKLLAQGARELAQTQTD